MKKKKLLAFVGILILSLVLFIFQGAGVGSHECSRNSDCPGAMMCLLGPDGYLKCRLPGYGEIGGPIPNNREDCLKFGGNWNMATNFKNSGFHENVTCTVSGELSFLGITIKGSYTKGNKYTMSWSSYTCEPSAENCCIKQGLFSGKDPI